MRRNLDLLALSSNCFHEKGLQSRLSSPETHPFSKSRPSFVEEIRKFRILNCSIIITRGNKLAHYRETTKDTCSVAKRAANGNFRCRTEKIGEAVFPLIF